MSTDLYDIYRNLGYSPEEAWAVMIGASESDDGIKEEE